MVDAIDLRLYLEEVLRIADVLAQRLRHLIERSEEVRVYLAVCPDDGIVLVDLVERDRPVEGVYDHLHAVADVVDALGARGVRVAIGMGVGVLHPEELSVGDDEVGVGIERQEGRDRLDAYLDIAAVEEAALVADRATDQDVRVAELPGVDHPPQERVEADAATAIVAVAHLDAASLVVELVLARVDDDVVVRSLAEVDARLHDIEDSRWRQPLNEVVGQALLSYFVHGHHCQAESVRELQPLVHPASRVLGQAILVQLPSSQHHLPYLAVDDVAVDIDIEEIVAGPERLSLVQRGQQRAVVPETDVADCSRVGGDLLGGNEGARRRQLLRQHVDAVKPVGESRRVDVTLDELALLHQFVRLDLEALDGGRIDLPSPDRDDDPEDDGADGQKEQPLPEGIDNNSDRDHAGQGH